MYVYIQFSFCAYFDALSTLSKHLKTSNLSFNEHKVCLCLVAICMPLKTLQATKLTKTAITHTKNCRMLTGVVNNDCAHF